MHRLGKAAAHVEELQAKRQACIAPQRMIGAKPQRLILIVAKRRHRRRQHVLGRLKARREITRLPLEPGVVKDFAGPVRQPLTARPAGFV